MSSGARSAISVADTNAQVWEWGPSRESTESAAEAVDSIERPTREGTREPCCADRWCWAHQPTKGPTGMSQMEVVIRRAGECNRGVTLPAGEFRGRKQ